MSLETISHTETAFKKKKKSPEISVKAMLMKSAAWSIQSEERQKECLWIPELGGQKAPLSSYFNSGNRADL